MRLHPTILGLALAATAISACAKPATVTASRSVRGQALVRSLADPKARDTAYCDLLGLRLYHCLSDAYQDTCGPVTEVINAPQPEGSPLHIVFSKPEYEIEREPIRRGPAGPFTIFDSNGHIVPVFSSANLVNYESELFAYSPTGQIAIGHVFGVSHGSSFDAGHWSVQTLHMVPTPVSQKPALSVVIGAPTFGFKDDCVGNFWSWRYRDLDADGWPEIQIGPEQTRKGTSRRRRRSAGRAPIKGTSAQRVALRISSSSFSQTIAKPSTNTRRPGGTCRRNALTIGCPGVDRVRVRRQPAGDRCDVTVT
jgi:hypothetical protein